MSAGATYGTKRCFHCLSVLSQTFSCARCKLVNYCNKDCQGKHWIKHKRFCIEQPVKKCAVGIRNLANTCYMASSIQLLYSLDLLRRYLLSGLYENDVNAVNPLSTQGRTIAAFMKLLQDMWKEELLAEVDPDSFVQEFTKEDPNFGDLFEQHDAQEFLSSLLDKLHEDVNRVQKKPYVEMPTQLEGESLLGCAARFEEYFKKRDDSFFHDTFGGLFLSTLECLNCLRSTGSFERFTLLQLPVPPPTPRTLRLVYFPEPLGSPATATWIGIPRNFTIRALYDRIAELTHTCREDLIVAVPDENNTTIESVLLRQEADAVKQEGGSPMMAFRAPMPPVDPVPTTISTVWVYGSQLESAENGSGEIDAEEVKDTVVVQVKWRRFRAVTGDSPSPSGQQVHPAVTPQIENDFTEKEFAEANPKFRCSVPTFIHALERTFDKEPIAYTISAEEQSAATGTVPCKLLAGSSASSETDNSVDVPVPLLMRISLSLTLEEVYNSVKKLLQTVQEQGFNRTRQEATGGQKEMFLDEVEMEFSESVRETRTRSRQMQRSSVLLQQWQTMRPEVAVPVEVNNEAAPPDLADSSFNLSLCSFIEIFQQREACLLCPVEKCCSGCRLSRGVEHRKTTLLEILHKVYGHYIDNPDIDKNELMQRMMRKISRMEFGLLTLAIDINSKAVPDFPFFPQASLVSSLRKSENIPPIRPSLPLEAVIKYSTQEEILTGRDAWQCDRCGKRTQTRKSHEVWKTGNVLLIQFKRFSHNSLAEKSTRQIELPLVNFDMSKFLASANHEQARQEPMTYRLVGVVRHSGNYNRGHYTAFCQSPIDKRWRLFDDEIVHQYDTPEEEQKRLREFETDAYIVAYQREKPEEA